MSKYFQEEWMKIYEEDIGGCIDIENENVFPCGKIESLNIIIHYANYLGYRLIEPTDIAIEGDKSFVFECGQVSLWVNEKDIPPMILKDKIGFVDNQKIISYHRWMTDMINNFNAKKENSDGDVISKIEIESFRVDREGYITGLNVWKWINGLKIYSTLYTDEILSFTYGITRDIFDPWTSGSIQQYKTLCCFTKDFDIIFNADGKYHINPLISIGTDITDILK